MRNAAASIALVLVLAAACGGTVPTSSPPTGPSPSARPSAEHTPTPAPSADVVGTLGAPGSLAFDRYDTALGAEGDYLGSAVIQSDSTIERPLAVPIEVEGLSPVWSPDGRRLVVNVWTPPNGPSTTALVDRDGSHFLKIGPKGLDGIGCSDWFPDGATLLCAVSNRDPDANGIYTLDADGAHLKRLTHSPYHDTVGSAGECGGGDARGVVSPDGSRIAFIRQRCGAGANPSSDELAAIELLDPASGDIRDLVPQGGVKSHPGSQLSWSPDGAWIAFGSQEGELFVVRADGTVLNRIPLSAGIGDHHAYGPEWSPDGKRIAFSMFVDSRNGTDLYTVAPDGSDLVRITSSDGAETFANWGPPEP